MLLVDGEGDGLDVPVLGHVVLQEVVRREPRVVPDEGRADGAVSPVPQLRQPAREATVRRVFEVQLGQARAALHLHDRLARVDRGGDHAEGSGGGGGAERLDRAGEVLGRVKSVEQLDRTRVGRRVTEARPRALDERETHTAVEAEDATVGVERAHGTRHRGAVPVLVINRRAHPHQREDVDPHRRRARCAPTKGGLGRLVQDLEHVHLLGRAVTRFLHLGHG
mmetsp:Transcript_44383/g.109944  ORF Transcript_44383/g.109944 Transcript_44383/m.109944 type:complete len:223 (-) Transcript_44383:81-749(-)